MESKNRYNGRKHLVRIQSVMGELVLFHKYKMALVLALLIGIAGTFFIEARQTNAQDIQQGIASQIIRFHVLANSDSDDDQALKLKVKEEIVLYMEEILQGAEDIEDTRQQIELHSEDIKEKAYQVIKDEGYTYTVAVNLKDVYFPVKTYGDLTFPAGVYEALQIQIGNAEGKNWWCVLYPNLCFIDATHAVVEEPEKQELKNILTEEEYASILGEPEIKIKFKFWEDLFGE